MAVPHPPNAVYPSLTTTTQLFALHSPFQIPMAYFNDTNGTSFYPTSSAYEFDAYPSQTSASEQANDQNFDAFANGWSVGSQPDYLVGSLTGFGTEESFGKHDLYSPLEDCGLTCASLQSQCLRYRTTVMTCRHIRNITGPQLASMPSLTPPVSWAGTTPSSARWPRKFRQRPPPPPIVSTFLS